MKNDVILKTESLTVGYKSKKATISIASDVNLEISKGNLTTLIGANGIGKSTLLKTITKVQNPLNGKIFLQDKLLENYSSVELAKQLSVVLTEKLPPSNLSVFELVALGRQPYTDWMGKLNPIDAKHVEKSIELTEISHLINKKHTELSDGQLQKVMIARALAQDTPLIILDEPTTHLDLSHKYLLFKLLKKISIENNKTILFSTHDIDLAIDFSDNIILMTKDFLIQETPKKLIETNAFNKIFKNENIYFDQQKEKFIYK